MLAEIPTIVAGAGWGVSATAVAAVYRRRAYTDSTTGLGNRAALYRTARRVRRRHGPIGLLMVDLDRFKSINDTHGHRYGNAVLTAVGLRLSCVAKPDERAFRLHGDEFVLWLGDLKSSRHAAVRAEQVSAALAKRVHVEGHPVTAFGSVGVATAPAGTSLSELLGRADEHMYRVKAAHHLSTVPTTPSRTRDHHPGGDTA
jgi:diguanylate cyclase (GGDEF)-like protein